MTSIATWLARRLPFFYGWIVVGVAFVTLGLAYSARSVFGLLFPPVLAEFGWDRGVTASVFSVGFVSTVLYTPLMGRWLDRYGPQRVLPVATVLVALGFVLTTMATEPWQFMATLGVLVVGATTILAFNGHFVFVPNWFEAKRGLALGIVSAGGGVFAMVSLPLFQWAIDGVGWRTGCVAFAVVLLAVVFPLTLLLQRQRPSDVGLAPDGARESDGREAHGGTRRQQRRLVVVDEAWAATEWTLGRAIRTARFWLFGFGFGAALFSWYALTVHQTQYLLDNGFDSTFAAAALGMVPLFGILGQIGLGVLSDRIGREWVWTISSLGYVLTGLALLALPANPAAWLVVAMVAVQGGLGFAVASVIGAVPADIFQGRHYGSIYGVLSIFGSTGAAAGPWVFGVLYDMTGTYALSFWVLIGASIASCAAIWIAAPRKVRAVRLTEQT